MRMVRDRLSDVSWIVCLAGALTAVACDGPRQSSTPLAPSTISATAGETIPPPAAPQAPTPAPAAPAGYTTFNATGLVTDIDDRPIAGAIITRAGADTGEQPATSGPNGEFSITFRVPDYYAAGHIAALFYAAAPGYEGPAGHAEILNFAIVNTQVRIRLQTLFDVATGASFSGSLMPNHPDWGWRNSMMCPCLRLHVHPVAGRETRIRITSSIGAPLRVGAAAQNLARADYYEQPEAFFERSGSLAIDGGLATSEIVIPDGFIYNAVVIIGRDGKTGVTSPVPFQLNVE